VVLVGWDLGRVIANQLDSKLWHHAYIFPLCRAAKRGKRQHATNQLRRYADLQACIKYCPLHAIN
jgi:hypothetical protein